MTANGTVAFLGGGRMGEALSPASSAPADAAADEVMVTCRREERARELAGAARRGLDARQRRRPCAWADDAGADGEAAGHGGAARSRSPST